jgi:hypothetical protein
LGCKLFLGTKTFEELAFTSLFPNWDPFAQIAKKTSLAAQLQEERRLQDFEYNIIEALNQED